jgi:hypothetical protein
MAKQKSLTDIVATLVEELTPLGSDERHRAIQASLTLLGEAPIQAVGGTKSNEQHGAEEDVGEFSARSRIWMRQNSISPEELLQVFHVNEGEVEIIASEIPGKSNRDKVRNAYVLLGIARLISLGEAKFDDKSARALCASSGFYDKTNHMKYMKGGNEFTGSKDKGWMLTAPGLKHGAEIIKELISAAQ